MAARWSNEYPIHSDQFRKRCTSGPGQNDMQQIKRWPSTRLFPDERATALEFRYTWHLKVTLPDFRLGRTACPATRYPLLPARRRPRDHARFIATCVLLAPPAGSIDARSVSSNRGPNRFALTHQNATSSHLYHFALSNRPVAYLPPEL